MKNYSWTLPLEVLYQDGIISLIQLNGFQFCGVRYLSDLRAEKHVIRNSYLKEEAVYLCSLINAVHIADNPNEDRKIFINSIPSHLKQIAEYSFRAINERIKSSVSQVLFSTLHYYSCIICLDRVKIYLILSLILNNDMF